MADRAERAVSIVEARRDLGKLAEQVRLTGRAIVLTRRGSPVARIAPEPSAALPAGLGALQGTLEVACSFSELEASIRDLRREWSSSLEQAGRQGKTGRRRG